MKSTHKFFFTILFFVITYYTNAQLKGTFIKTNLLNLSLNRPSIQIEQQVNANQSFQIHFATGKANWLPFTDYYSFKTIDAEYRFYTLNQRLNGFFIAPYAKWIERNIYREKTEAGPYNIFGNDERNFTGAAIAAGARTGFQYLIKNKWSLELETGLGYGKYYKQSDVSNPSKKSGGFLDFTFQFSVGVKVL